MNTVAGTAPSPPERVLRTWLDPDATRLFHKGRVALHAILEAANIGPGHEVLVPAFTCFVVAAAIQYRGARPVYYDTMAGHLNGDLDLALHLCTDRTRAIVVQHTLGWPNDPSSRLDAFRSRGLLVIEDCAHTIASTVRGEDVGTLGDAAFTSLQWSKPAVLGLGGIARANAPKLAAALADVHRSYQRPGHLSEIVLEVLRLAHEGLVRPATHDLVRGVYRRLSKLGLVPGSSSRSEFDDTVQPPARYERTMGRLRASRAKSALSVAAMSTNDRRRNYQRVAELLADTIDAPHLDEGAAISVPLRMPLLVEDRAILLAAAARSRLEIGDWFVSVLHPLRDHLESLSYRSGSCPHAESLASTIVNVPISSARHMEQAPAIRNLLRSHRGYTSMNRSL